MKCFQLGRPIMVMVTGAKMKQKHYNFPMEVTPHCDEGKNDNNWKLILAGSRFTLCRDHICCH